MSESSDEGYRAAGTEAPVRASFPFVARMRFIDSVFIPAFVVMGITGFFAAVTPAPVSYCAAALLVAEAFGAGWLYRRLSRPCLLEAPFPYRTIRISVPPERPRTIDVELITNIRTAIADGADNSIVYHVVFELSDGRTVPLHENTHYFFFDQPHAERLVARVRAFVDEVRARGQGP